MCNSLFILHGVLFLLASLGKADVFIPSLLLGLWSLESSSMAVVIVVWHVLQTMFGMVPFVLKRHHYNGLGGPVPKSSGAMTSSVNILNGAWAVLYWRHKDCFTAMMWVCSHLNPSP